MQQPGDTHHPATTKATTTIRPATGADAGALRRLAELDSAPKLTGDVLGAERSGVMLAAIAVEFGSAIADPFRRTAPLTTMLAMQRRDLARGPAGRPIGLDRRPNRGGDRARFTGRG